MDDEVRDDGEPAVWRALADPTRRRLLDVLRLGPRTTGELAAGFPISRIAIMRHLGALADAGLVVSRKRGRQRWHYVNLAPILRLHERWSTPVSQGLASGLLGLKDAVEAHVNLEVSTLDIAVDVRIEASPAAVFVALCEQPGAWWGHPFLRADATRLTLSGELGAQLLEHWPEGGTVLATVTGVTRDRWLQLSGSFHLGVTHAVASFDLTPVQGGTLLALDFRATGLIDPERAEAFRGGWRELVSVRLKAFVEHGTRLGIDPG
jgi:DNA-binding transcriptional ArsR family regulator